MSTEKRSFLFLAVLLGLVFLLTPGWAQSNVQVRKYAIAVSDANIRSNPTTQSSILTVVRAGEKMEVLDDLGTWFKVKTPSGVVGYVWGKLVRIEVEKVIKEVTPETPQTPPKPQKPETPPAPQTTSRPKLPSTAGGSDVLTQAREAKFDFSFNFTYALVNPEDFWAWGRTFNTIFEYYEQIWVSYGYTPQMDEPLTNLKHMLGGDAELKYFLKDNFAIGVGFTLLSGSKDEKRRLEVAGTYMEVNQALKSSITAPFLALHFYMPSETVNFEVFAGAGYYIGKFSADYLYTTNFSRPFSVSLTDMKKSTPGFFGGLRVNFPIQENMGIFVAGKYDYIKFTDIEGKYSSGGGGGTYTTGKVYYYEILSNGRWLPMLTPFQTPPAPSRTLRNIRPAEFNFSGINLSLGFFVKF